MPRNRRGAPSRAGVRSGRRVAVYFTESEYQEIETAAKTARQPVGALVRDLALGALADDGEDFFTSDKRVVTSSRNSSASNSRHT